MSNCIIFAVRKYWNEGGYIAFRRTRKDKYGRRGFWPHVIWIGELNDARIEHLVPMEDFEHPLIKKILFKGYIKKDDL